MKKQTFKTIFGKTPAVRVSAAVALLLAVSLLLLSGCVPAGPVNDGSPDPLQTGEPVNEISAAEGPFALWEERSMKEMIEVGAVTSVTADMKVYNAQDLGIEPGARKDASPEIKAAAETVLSKGGGVLYFPSGYYRIDTPLEFTGEGTWLCLCGDVDGSTVFSVKNRLEGNALQIAKNNTHFSFLSFEDGSKNAVTLSIEADGCSLYGCSFRKTSAKAEGTCIEVSGSFDTVRQCSFWSENPEACFAEFTKYPGRDAFGNVMCDVHFGGDFAKTVLVTSRDDAGSQENLTFFRNLFLISSDPNIEVRTVNGLVIANNMLDAATRAVAVEPEGIGVFNMEIRDNYIGTKLGGVKVAATEAPAGNISIHDNYFWSPSAITVMGKNRTGIEIFRNYFVLATGNAVYMSLAKNAVIEGNLLANIGSSEPELCIAARDGASKIDAGGFKTANVPDKEIATDDIAIPAVSAKKQSFAKAPETTGDGTVPVNPKYVNVRDFGAAGDGVTDDTEAIKESVKKAKSISGTVYFPEGVYLVTDTVSVSKDDSKVLRFKGDGAGKTVIKGGENLMGSVFDVGMKYNFFMYDLKILQSGEGSCLDALFVKAFDCAFEGNPGSSAPLLWFHGSNCWSVRCDYYSESPDCCALSYTRSKGEISINDYIIDNTFRGACRGVLVGDGSTTSEGRCEGLKIIGNTFENTGASAAEIYEILHVNIAYNTVKGPKTGVFLSNLGHGPDGIYIDHNFIDANDACVTSGTVPGGGDYISMVVIHANTFGKPLSEAVREPVSYNKKMVTE